MSKLTSMTLMVVALGMLSWCSTGCRGLLGQQQQSSQKNEQPTGETVDGVTLPFQISTRARGEYDTFAAPHTKIYRFAKKTPPAGFPVVSNAYASVRAIDVATGEIVWIDTVNVRTRGISETTGLERLGIAMAGNFSGRNTEANALLIYNGETYRRPSNWEQVVADFPKATAVGSRIRQVHRRRP
ncbi:MAG: hypothetical protein HN750_07815 [Gemmatimonadales bacterium]|jgi:hypothetical protein|nr:hypothetical protein [Gemmatimonadales bacterium]